MLHHIMNSLVLKFPEVAIVNPVMSLPLDDRNFATNESAGPFHVGPITMTLWTEIAGLIQFNWLSFAISIQFHYIYSERRYRIPTHFKEIPHRKF